VSKLFSQIQVGGVTFKNRAWVSPMCQYSAVNGLIQDWHAVHYGAFITGGAGLVMVEAAAVHPDGRITHHDAGIWTDQQAQVLAEIPRFAHRFGTKAGIQIAHAGRKASTDTPWSGRGMILPADGGWQSVAPSPIAFEGYLAPVELTLADIALIRADFVAAAERAMSADFDVVEIHAAHGYLLHEFFSPISNQRTDDYGGSFENRIKLLCEIASEIRLVVPKSRALFVRISATDWIAGGWSIDDSVALARELQARGVDLIDCSSGGISTAQQIEIGPGYQVEFARKIHEESGILTNAVGMITTGEQAEAVLAGDDIAAVMIGRAMLGNPRWPIQAASDLGDEIPWPNQYARGFTSRR
jgi:2,4-dienoyl-CoA reductase-like NADH-dependent reductase (Old Yellow Enzyme family)